MRTARLLPYDGPGGELQLFFDGMLTAWVSGLLVVQLRELRIASTAVHSPPIKNQIRRHLLQKWVAYEWVMIGFFFAVLGLKYYVRAPRHSGPALRLV